MGVEKNNDQSKNGRKNYFSAAARLPKGADDRVLLRRRAEQLASQQEKTEESELIHYLRFRLGAIEWYGIPYQWLDEIIYADSITHVPGSPSFVSGVVNHRAELLTVLNLKYFFRTQVLESNDEARIIIVRGAGLHVGLLVDLVEGDDDYIQHTLAPATPSDGVIKINYISGIHQGQVSILDLEKMLSDPELLVNQSM